MKSKRSAEYMAGYQAGRNARSYSAPRPRLPNTTREEAILELIRRLPDDVWLGAICPLVEANAKSVVYKCRSVIPQHADGVEKEIGTSLAKLFARVGWGASTPAANQAKETK